MKPVLMVILPLVVIIALGAFCQNILQNDADKMSLQLEKLETNVEHKNWEKAESHVKQIDRAWKPIRFTWQILIDHAEVDRIDESLVRAKKSIFLKEQSDSLVEISVLRQMLLHLPEKERPHIENIF